MQSSFQVTDDILLAVAYGEIDHHTASKLRDEIDEAMTAFHCRHLILDMKRVSFMDSSGIGVIMGRYRTVYLLGGEVWAVNANERMKKILSMSGVTKIIQVYEEEEV